MLTAELVRPHTKDNLVMVTWANNHYYDFVKNWVYNLNKIGVRFLPMPPTRWGTISCRQPFTDLLDVAESALSGATKAND